MIPKKFALLLAALLLFSYCSRSFIINTDPEPTNQPGQEETPANILETVKSKNGTLITEKEAAAIQKISETAFKENVFQSGVASWYGQDFHGKRTANGEIYDMHKLTAAHKTLPFNTLVEVENLDNGKRVTVRVNDRGPFLKDRILDLSYDAAKKLGGHEDGIIPVALRIVKPNSLNGQEPLPPLVTPPIDQPPETAAKTKTETTPEQSETKESEKPYVPPVEVPKTKFFLQVGAFSEKDNALKMLKNLKLILADVPFDIYFQNGLYKVISLPLPSRTRAEELRKALRDIDIAAFIKEQ